jgi:hypothetical protein
MLAEQFRDRALCADAERFGVGKVSRLNRLAKMNMRSVAGDPLGS